MNEIDSFIGALAEPNVGTSLFGFVTVSILHSVRAIQLFTALLFSWDFPFSLMRIA
eukprot:m.411663 g.411663  ORF g.411663 m.411663 type:complete len:56 (+) comp56555_c2_seq5:1565-1732(+)